MIWNNYSLFAWDEITSFRHKASVTSARGILFVMCCLFAGVAIHFGSKKYRYPYTVGCFLFGVIIGVMQLYSPFVQNFTVLTRMEPSNMLMTFLPILIFESSFGMDAHMFFKALPQCVILAVVGFLFCTALTAVYAKYVLVSYGWSWVTAILFGSIVSATDPVAVVALLRDMKMPHTFTVIIEGESLLNDGVAIVMYELISKQIESGESFVFKTTVLELLKTCIGAPIFGYIMGYISELVLIHIYINPVSEMTVTIVMAYASYFVAERFLGISAILAVVLYGVTLNARRMCISPESEGLIHTDWRLLAVFANTVIFIFVGILVTVGFTEFYSEKDAWLILLTYVFLTILRSVMILIFCPILQRTGYGLNWKEGVILSWGGLRGAIGLALSLMLALNPHIPDTVKADKVLVQVSGIIVLTLIVNANTVKFVMKLIKFKTVTLVNRLSMGNAFACVTEVRDKALRICKRDWKLMKADWKWVIRKTTLDDPYEGGLYDDDPSMCSLFIPYGTCDECLAAQLPYIPSANEMDELKEATRKKVLRALKGHLWKQFRVGLLQRRSLKLLCAAADHSSDTPEMFLKAEDVRKKLMEVGWLNHWLETKLSSFIEHQKLRSTSYIDVNIHLRKSKEEKFRSWCGWVFFSWWFDPLVFSVIVLNVLHIAADMYFIAHPKSNKYEDLLFYFGAFFIVFYLWEFMIKVCTLLWNRFIKSHWNKLDFVLSIIAVVEGIIDLILSKFPSLHTFGSHIRILIALRLIRYFYTTVNVLVIILSIIRNYASSELYHAYDIGRGFLFASEAVLKNVDMIVDFGPCARVPISVCEKNIKEMLDVLDEFEKSYPSVATALRSNRTARKILNKVKSVLNHFMRKSHISPEDAREIKLILFKMTKKVVTAPKNHPVIGNIEIVLQEVDWITSELSGDVYENHSVVTYKPGEIIQEEGQNHQFVHIIASGIVKIVGEIMEGESDSVYNKLPNVDSFLFFHEVKYAKFKETSFYEYLTTSQTIGLLGYLQKTPSFTAAMCEKDCELIRIDYSYLDEALEKYEDLLYNMWKSIAVKISFQLLKRERRYMILPPEDIYLRLQKGILPNLIGMASWDVPVIVEDMVLIQGRIKDASTNVEFIGPSHIPSTSRYLQLPDDSSKRHRIIMLLLLHQRYDLFPCKNWVKPDVNNGMLLLEMSTK